MRTQTATQAGEFTAAMLHYGPGPHPDGTPQAVHGGDAAHQGLPDKDAGQMAMDFTAQPEPQLSPEEARRQKAVAARHRKEANDALAQAANDKLVAAWKSKKDTRVGGEWAKTKYPDMFTWTDPDGIEHTLQTRSRQSFKTSGRLRIPSGTSREVGADLISMHPDGVRSTRTSLFKRAARGESAEADQRMSDARQELRERIMRKFGIANPGI